MRRLCALKHFGLLLVDLLILPFFLLVLVSWRSGVLRKQLVEGQEDGVENTPVDPSRAWKISLVQSLQLVVDLLFLVLSLLLVFAPWRLVVLLKDWYYAGTAKERRLAVVQQLLLVLLDVVCLLVSPLLLCTLYRLPVLWGKWTDASTVGCCSSWPLFLSSEEREDLDQPPGMCRGSKHMSRAQSHVNFLHQCGLVLIDLPFFVLFVAIFGAGIPSTRSFILVRDVWRLYHNMPEADTPYVASHRRWCVVHHLIALLGDWVCFLFLPFFVLAFYRVPTVRRKIREGSGGLWGLYDPQQSDTLSRMLKPHRIVLQHAWRALLDFPFVCMGAVVVLTVWRLPALVVDLRFGLVWASPTSESSDGQKRWRISSSHTRSVAWARRAACAYHLFMLVVDPLVLAASLVPLCSIIRSVRASQRLFPLLSCYSPLVSWRHMLCCADGTVPEEESKDLRLDRKHDDEQRVVTANTKFRHNAHLLPTHLFYVCDGHVAVEAFQELLETICDLPVLPFVLLSLLVPWRSIVVYYDYQSGGRRSGYAGVRQRGSAIKQLLLVFADIPCAFMVVVIICTVWRAPPLFYAFLELPEAIELRARDHANGQTASRASSLWKVWLSTGCRSLRWHVLVVKHFVLAVVEIPVAVSCLILLLVPWRHATARHTLLLHPKHAVAMSPSAHVTCCQRLSYGRNARLLLQALLLLMDPFVLCLSLLLLWRTARVYRAVSYLSALYAFPEYAQPDKRHSDAWSLWGSPQFLGDVGPAGTSAASAPSMSGDTVEASAPAGPLVGTAASAPTVSAAAASDTLSASAPPGPGADSSAPGTVLGASDAVAAFTAPHPSAPPGGDPGLGGVDTEEEKKPDDEAISLPGEVQAKNEEDSSEQKNNLEEEEDVPLEEQVALQRKDSPRVEPRGEVVVGSDNVLEGPLFLVPADGEHLVASSPSPWVVARNFSKALPHMPTGRLHALVIAELWRLMMDVPFAVMALTSSVLLVRAPMVFRILFRMPHKHRPVPSYAGGSQGNEKDVDNAEVAAEKEALPYRLQARQAVAAPAVDTERSLTTVTNSEFDEPNLRAYAEAHPEQRPHSSPKPAVPQPSDQREPGISLSYTALLTSAERLWDEYVEHDDERDWLRRCLLARQFYLLLVDALVLVCVILLVLFPWRIVALVKAWRLRYSKQSQEHRHGDINTIRARIVELDRQLLQAGAGGRADEEEEATVPYAQAHKHLSKEEREDLEVQKRVLEQQEQHRIDADLLAWRKVQSEGHEQDDLFLVFRRTAWLKNLRTDEEQQLLMQEFLQLLEDMPFVLIAFCMFPFVWRIEPVLSATRLCGCGADGNEGPSAQDRRGAVWEQFKMLCLDLPHVILGTLLLLGPPALALLAVQHGVGEDWHVIPRWVCLALVGVPFRGFLLCYDLWSTTRGLGAPPRWVKARHHAVLFLLDPLLLASMVPVLASHRGKAAWAQSKYAAASKEEQQEVLGHAYSSLVPMQKRKVWSLTYGYYGKHEPAFNLGQRETIAADVMSQVKVRQYNSRFGRAVAWHTTFGRHFLGLVWDIPFIVLAGVLVLTGWRAPQLLRDLRGTEREPKERVQVEQRIDAELQKHGHVQQKQGDGELNNEDSVQEQEEKQQEVQEASASEAENDQDADAFPGLVRVISQGGTAAPLPSGEDAQASEHADNNQDVDATPGALREDVNVEEKEEEDGVEATPGEVIQGESVPPRKGKGKKRLKGTSPRKGRSPARAKKIGAGKGTKVKQKPVKKQKSRKQTKATSGETGAEDIPEQSLHWGGSEAAAAMDLPVQSPRADSDVSAGGHQHQRRRSRDVSSDSDEAGSESRALPADGGLSITSPEKALAVLNGAVYGDTIKKEPSLLSADSAARKQHEIQGSNRSSGSGSGSARSSISRTSQDPLSPGAQDSQGKRVSRQDVMAEHLSAPVPTHNAWEEPQGEESTEQELARGLVRAYDTVGYMDRFRWLALQHFVRFVCLDLWFIVLGAVVCAFVYRIGELSASLGQCTHVDQRRGCLWVQFTELCMDFPFLLLGAVVLASAYRSIPLLQDLNSWRTGTAARRRTATWQHFLLLLCDVVTVPVGVAVFCLWYRFPRFLRVYLDRSTPGFLHGYRENMGLGLRSLSHQLIWSQFALLCLDLLFLVPFALTSVAMWGRNFYMWYRLAGEVPAIFAACRCWPDPRGSQRLSDRDTQAQHDRVPGGADTTSQPQPHAAAAGPVKQTPIPKLQHAAVVWNEPALVGVRAVVWEEFVEMLSDIPFVICALVALMCPWRAPLLLRDVMCACGDAASRRSASWQQAAMVILDVVTAPMYVLLWLTWYRWVPARLEIRDLPVTPFSAFTAEHGKDRLTQYAPVAAQFFGLLVDVPFNVLMIVCVLFFPFNYRAYLIHSQMKREGKWYGKGEHRGCVFSQFCNMLLDIPFAVLGLILIPCFWRGVLFVHKVKKRMQLAETRRHLVWTSWRLRREVVMQVCWVPLDILSLALGPVCVVLFWRLPTVVAGVRRGRGVMRSVLRGVWQAAKDIASLLLLLVVLLGIQRISPFFRQAKYLCKRFGKDKRTQEKRVQQQLKVVDLDLETGKAVKPVADDHDVKEKGAEEEKQEDSADAQRVWSAALHQIRTEDGFGVYHDHSGVDDYAHWHENPAYAPRSLDQNIAVAELSRLVQAQLLAEETLEEEEQQQQQQQQQQEEEEEKKKPQPETSSRDVHTRRLSVSIQAARSRLSRVGSMSRLRAQTAAGQVQGIAGACSSGSCSCQSFIEDAAMAENHCASCGHLLVFHAPKAPQDVQTDFVAEASVLGRASGTAQSSQQKDVPSTHDAAKEVGKDVGDVEEAQQQDAQEALPVEQITPVEEDKDEDEADSGDGGDDETDKGETLKAAEQFLKEEEEREQAIEKELDKQAARDPDVGELLDPQRMSKWRQTDYPLSLSLLRALLLREAWLSISQYGTVLSTALLFPLRLAAYVMLPVYMWMRVRRWDMDTELVVLQKEQARRARQRSADGKEEALELGPLPPSRAGQGQEQRRQSISHSMVERVPKSEAEVSVVAPSMAHYVGGPGAQAVDAPKHISMSYFFTAASWCYVRLPVPSLEWHAFQQMEKFLILNLLMLPPLLLNELAVLLLGTNFLWAVICTLGLGSSAAQAAHGLREEEMSCCGRARFALSYVLQGVLLPVLIAWQVVLLLWPVAGWYLMDWKISVLPLAVCAIACNALGFTAAMQLSRRLVRYRFVSMRPWRLWVDTAGVLLAFALGKGWYGSLLRLSTRFCYLLSKQCSFLGRALGELLVAGVVVAWVALAPFAVFVLQASWFWFVPAGTLSLLWMYRARLVLKHNWKADPVMSVVFLISSDQDVKKDMCTGNSLCTGSRRKVSCEVLCSHSIAQVLDDVIRPELVEDDGQCSFLVVGRRVVDVEIHREESLRDVGVRDFETVRAVVHMREPPPPPPPGDDTPDLNAMIEKRASVSWSANAAPLVVVVDTVHEESKEEKEEHEEEQEEEQPQPDASGDESHEEQKEQKEQKEQAHVPEEKQGATAEVQPYMLQPGWVQTNPDSAFPCYTHTDTGEVTHSAPLLPEFMPVDQSRYPRPSVPPPMVRQDTEAHMLLPGWVRLMDPDSTIPYYANVETGDVTWETPLRPEFQ